MAFITEFNAKRLTMSSELKNVDFKDSIYKRKIYFFNKFEKNELLAFKAFISTPEKYVRDFYVPVNVSDTGTYVFEYAGKKPSYHGSSDCFFLHQDFRNMKIPKGIREAGIDIHDFRAWFRANLLEAYRNGRTDVIQMRILAKYGVEVNQQDFVHLENSDVVKYKNFSLEELEEEIEKGIKAAGRYYFEHEEVLTDFSLRTYLAYRSAPIEGNETGMSDEDLKKFLRDYNERFKKPVKRLLMEWYRVGLNPQLEFTGDLLEQLNFKSCSHCRDADSEYSEGIDFSIPPPGVAPEIHSDEGEHEDDLPF